MKKSIFALLIVVLLLSCVTFTSFAKDISTSDIDIYWVGKTLNNPWWISVADFAQKEADSLGVNLTIAFPQEEVDLEKQVSMIDAAVEMGVDALVVSASSSDGVIPAIKTCA